MFQTQEDCDRQARQDVFDKEIYPLLEGSYVVNIDPVTNRCTVTTYLGKFDFYPKSNKLMFHSPHKWIDNGLEWILNNLYV